MGTQGLLNATGTNFLYAQIVALNFGLKPGSTHGILKPGFKGKRECCKWCDRVYALCQQKDDPEALKKLALKVLKKLHKHYKRRFRRALRNKRLQWLVRLKILSLLGFCYVHCPELNQLLVEMFGVARPFFGDEKLIADKSKHDAFIDTSPKGPELKASACVEIQPQSEGCSTVNLNSASHDSPIIDDKSLDEVSRSLSRLESTISSGDQSQQFVVAPPSSIEKPADSSIPVGLSQTPHKIVRRFIYRIYPSPQQVVYLSKIFGCGRFVYNHFLALNIKRFKESKLPRLTCGEMQHMLIQLKKDHPFLAEVPSQPLQVATHDLDVAYQNFYAKDSKKPPRFKTRARAKRAFQLPQPTHRIHKGQYCIFLPKFKTWIPINQHRPFPPGAVPKSATLTETKAGAFYVSFVVTFEALELLDSKSQEMLGIDLNIKGIALSSEVMIPTPQRISKLEERMALMQQHMQRQRDEQKKRGDKEWSNNYKKAKKQYAKLHARLKNIKMDFFWKTATRLFRENQSIAMETLNIKGMLKNHKLARSIAYQSWGTFAKIMRDCAQKFGKNLYFIDQWYASSKICSSCGAKKEKLTLKEREWTCTVCGTTHDRDFNAAKNIAKVAAQGGSYPKSLTERKSSRTRPKRKSTSTSKKQESSRFEAPHENETSAGSPH
jgi:putative transposase